MKALTLCVACLLCANSMAATYPYQRCFEIAAQMHDLPVDLLLAVAATESNWDAHARSDANAHGVMQIQWPGTARHLGVVRVAELYNPCRNIELGARYLRELLDATGRDEARALASYNYGPTRIRDLAVIPAGAQAYIDRVAAHRARVRRDNSSWIAPDSKIELNRFDSALRARRYARHMNGKLSGAVLSSLRRRDGTYSVTLTVSPEGLSAGDAMLLESIGWGTSG